MQNENQFSKKNSFNFSRHLWLYPNNISLDAFRYKIDAFQLCLRSIHCILPVCHLKVIVKSDCLGFSGKFLLLHELECLGQSDYISDWIYGDLFLETFSSVSKIFVEYCTNEHKILISYYHTKEID